MRRYIKYILSAALLFSALWSTAQTITIRGRVLDQDNMPLPGATVAVKGSSSGAVADANGNYSLDATPGAVLLAQYIGYTDSEITVGKKTVIDFILSEDNTFLEEVVVVGYGVQKKVNMTGSVSTVAYEDVIKSRPIQTAQQALAGASAGVIVNQGSGKPGQEDITVRIRGIGTLNNAAPLVIVDGFESTMAAVNPDDIATISILKDAASSARRRRQKANTSSPEVRRGQGMQSRKWQVFSSLSSYIIPNFRPHRQFPLYI